MPALPFMCLMVSSLCFNMPATIRYLICDTCTKTAHKMTSQYTIFNSMPYLLRLYLKCIIEMRIKNMNLLYNCQQQKKHKAILLSDIPENIANFYANATNQLAMENFDTSVTIGRINILTMILSENHKYYQTLPPKFYNIFPNCQERTKTDSRTTIPPAA